MTYNLAKPVSYVFGTKEDLSSKKSESEMTGS